MNTRLVKLAEQFRSSLWPVPAVSTIAAAVLALAVTELDRLAGVADRQIPWTFHGGAESARVILSTIAGSMITVAGTVYSITIVVLTLASIQFAPRVVRGFMRDRVNQVVLGFFVATFTYCLLVLGSVRGTDQEVFVPALAVTGGLLLALASLGMLIYFIDHIFHALQVSSIIASIALETEQQIELLYPELWRADAAYAELQPPQLPAVEDWMPINAKRSGYLQYVDYDGLMRLVTRERLLLKEERTVGAFITAGAPLAFVSPPVKISPRLEEAINSAFVLGTNPTMQQDVAFGIRQIVDIALKAISPAVNDPTTAMNCIDHLGAILTKLAGRSMHETHRSDGADQDRLFLNKRNFHDLVRLAFDQIRHYGAGDHIVVLRLLDALMQISLAAEDASYRKALLDYVERIAATAEHQIGDPFEKQVVQVRVLDALALLQEPTSSANASTTRS